MSVPRARARWAALFACALLLAFLVIRPSLAVPVVLPALPEPERMPVSAEVDVTQVEPPARAAPTPGAVVPPYEPAPLEPSHPVTDEHERLQHVQRLLGGLNDALDARDPAAMRTLLERYDEADPEDVQQLREGYDRIADCFEARNAEALRDARANAERYYREARASTLRRFVRRHCLESAH